MSSDEAGITVFTWMMQFLLAFSLAFFIGRYIEDNWQSIYERRVVNRYRIAGLAYGDMLVNGAPSDFQFFILMRDFLKWEKRYQHLGYRLLSIESWALAGGCGFKMDHELRIKDPHWCRYCKCRHNEYCGEEPEEEPEVDTIYIHQ